MHSFILSITIASFFVPFSASLPFTNNPLDIQFAPIVQYRVPRPLQPQGNADIYSFAQTSTAQKPLHDSSTFASVEATNEKPGKQMMYTRLRFQSSNPDNKLVHYVEIPLRQKLFVRKFSLRLGRTIPTLRRKKATTQVSYPVLVALRS